MTTHWSINGLVLQCNKQIDINIHQFRDTMKVLGVKKHVCQSYVDHLNLPSKWHQKLNDAIYIVGPHITHIWYITRH